MENFTIGFIGGGALAGALLNGIAGKLIPAENIYVSEFKQERCDELNREFGVHASVGADGFIDKVDMVLIAVKPKDAKAAMEGISSKVREDTVIISVVAGLRLSIIEENFPKQPVIRVMPNVPQAVGAGMAAYALGSRADRKTAERIALIWNSVGRTVEVDEHLMDAVTGLSGSGPAYGFLMIDAMADGGVAAGLPRNTAILLAAQTLFGAAKMVLETGKHPDVLRDMVTSPGGTTIAGVRELEAAGVRSALIEAVLAATEKSKVL